MDINVKKAKIVLEKEINPEGRIYGLKEYAGHKAKIIILEQEGE